MKKFGILLLALVLLLGCTSCFTNYKEVKTDAVEPVGNMPEFWEEEVVPNDASYYCVQAGNLLLYELYDIGQKVTIAVVDVSSETTKTLKYEYKTAEYYLEQIHPAKDGNFFLLFTINSYAGEGLLPLIVKSDTDGNVLWEAEVQNPDLYSFTALAEADNGDVYALGYTERELSDTQESADPVPLSYGDDYNGYYEDFFGNYDELYLYENQAYIARFDADGNRIMETAIEDMVANSVFSDAVYLENVGLIATYITYTTDYETTGVYTLCLDESGKPVWKTKITDDYYTYPVLAVFDGQIYACMQTQMPYGCKIYALNGEGAILWSQIYEDDNYAIALTDTKENQIVVARTDESFTVNAADGSIDRYLWKDVAGTVYRMYSFDDYYIVYSDHICGGYYDGFVRMGDLYESVYSAYDYEGNLLWRKGFTS